MDKNTVREIEKLLGLQTEREDISTSEVGEIFSQITLPLLIIFIMIYVVFLGQAKAYIAAAKDGLGVLQGKFNDIIATPAGKQYEKRTEALVDLQRQKLLLALEKIENRERSDYGVSFFVLKDINGKTEYLMSDILSEGKVINERFKGYCILAKERISDQKKVRDQWLAAILLANGMKLSSSPVEESIVDHPEILNRENALWLMAEIERRVGTIYFDCCDMQSMAFAYLVEYYKSHTDLLGGTQLGKLADNLLLASDEEKARLASEFSRELYNYVKSLFESQGVPLLSGA